MEKINFSDCTLARMEETFGLMAVKKLPSLTAWVTTDFELSDFDKKVIDRFNDVLQDNVLHWNEQDLSLHFIGPVFSLV